MFTTEHFIVDVNSYCFVLLVLCLVVQLYFLWCVFSRFAFQKRAVQLSDKEQEPVSIVICAKNEVRFLRRFLPLIMEQDYPVFEVVVVDDNSDDGINEALTPLMTRYANLHLVHISTNMGSETGKQLALAVGIRSAQYDLVLLTDADCMPRSNQWIRSMVSEHKNGKSIVLGYGAYEQKAGFLDKLIRFDTLHTAIQYFSFAIKGKPYMGVGRNLMYEKNLYLESYGYLSAYKSISGDDDLFVNSIANKSNTTYMYAPEAHTISVQRNFKFSQWLIQKSRHLSASKYYRKNNKFTLGVYWMSNFLFYFSFILALFLCKHTLEAFVVLIGIYLIKILSQFIIFAQSGKKLQETHLNPYIPLLDICFVLLMPLLQLKLLIKKQTRWN